MEELYHKDSGDDRYKRSGDLIGYFGPYDKDKEADGIDNKSLPVKCAYIGDDRLDLIRGLYGLSTLGIDKACKILYLTDNDSNGDTCGKACRDRIRMMPARIVAVIRPDIPFLATIPATIVAKAAVGPAI